jgi:hypothetical protein
MVLHASGTIFASQIASEYNRNTSGTFFLGSSGRTLDSRVPQSGGINFSSFYNKYSRPAASNLRVWLDAKEYSGSGTTWTDLQGNANATLVNAPTYAKPYFDFNGTTQYATVPDITNITDFTSSDSYTISAWVWLNSTQNWTSTTDNDIIEKWGVGDGYPYTIRLDRPNASLGIGAYDGVTGTGTTTSNNTVIYNDWNHISAVYDWPSRNLLTNGSFAGNAHISEYNASASYGTNNIVTLSNPGDSQYVLQQAGSGGAEYEMNFATQLVANTTYTMSGWYSKSADYNGTDTMFHSRAFSSSGNNIDTGLGLFNILETRVVGGLTWYFCYTTITTPADYSNAFYWFLGYGANNTTGFRYYTKLSLIKGAFPKTALNVYINGKLTKDSTLANITGIDNTHPIYLMCRGGPINFVTGRFGMLMIHNAALAASEISRMYYATRNVFEIDTIELENGTWNVLYEYVNPKRNASNALVTARDTSATLGTPTVNRIGYFMQNNMGNGSVSYWILVTMDAYTSTLSQLKIPDPTNAFINQRNVTNLRVYSNHPQVGNYTAANGRLEIWPNGYIQTSNLGGGNTTIYDFDDSTDTSGSNYGSVQIHDITNSKTLLAWNEHRFNSGTVDVGIGNNDSTNIHYNATAGVNRDWTFAQNGAYNWKFQVLIGTIPIEPATLESGTWNLLYELTNPKRDNNGMFAYSKNNATLLGNRQFTKVGYYMQNNMGNGPTSYYVYVTMDAYTTSLRDLKIPDNVDAFINQRNVRNLQIYSNHPQIGNYSAANGRLEIWPYNYSTTTTFGDGNGGTWDFDDTPNIVADGHGSVQVHDITNLKTILAWNNHRNSVTQDIGLGTNNVSNINYNASGAPDWTNAGNGAFNWKFQVYIKI